MKAEMRDALASVNCYPDWIVKDGLVWKFRKAFDTKKPLEPETIKLWERQVTDSLTALGIQHQVILSEVARQQTKSRRYEGPFFLQVLVEIPQ